MPTLTAKQLPSKLNPVPSCVVLTGQDPFMVQESARLIKAKARAQGFEQHQLFVMESASSFDWQGLTEALNTPPMFADKMIVEWVWQTNKLPTKDIQALAPFEFSDCVLIIRAGYLTKAQLNAAWFKPLSSGLVVQHWPMQKHELVSWTLQKAKALNVELPQGAPDLLAGHYGERVYALSQLITKLAGTSPTLEQIQSHMDSQSQFDAFALQSALLHQDTSRVVEVLNHLKQTKQELTLVLWTINRLIESLMLSLKGPLSGPELKAKGIWPKETQAFNQLIRLFDESKGHSFIRMLSDIEQQFKTGQTQVCWQNIMNLCLMMIGALPHVHHLSDAG